VEAFMLVKFGVVYSSMEAASVLLHFSHCRCKVRSMCLGT